MLWEQALTNMVELKGTHWFEGVFKQLLPEWRNQGLTEDGHKILNTRVIGGKDRNGNIVEMPDMLKRLGLQHITTRIMQASMPDCFMNTLNDSTVR